MASDREKRMVEAWRHLEPLVAVDVSQIQTQEDLDAAKEALAVLNGAVAKSEAKGGEE